MGRSCAVLRFLCQSCCCISSTSSSSCCCCRVQIFGFNAVRLCWNAHLVLTRLCLVCLFFLFFFWEKWENVHKAAFRLAIREASGKPRLKSSFPPGLKMLLAPPHHHHHHPVIPSEPPSVSQLASSPAIDWCRVRLASHFLGLNFMKSFEMQQTGLARSLSAPRLTLFIYLFYKQCMKGCCC